DNYTIGFDSPEPYWARLSDQLQNDALVLSDDVRKIFDEFARESTGSMLLNDIDRERARVLARTILSALRLRRYQVNSAEIIHDEGRFIAYQEERHSDDTPLSPTEAVKVCQEAFESLLELSDNIASNLHA